MKPQTIKVMTDLTVEAIKEELRSLVDITEDIDRFSVDFREIAIGCQNIIDAAEALQDVALTAADEADRIDAAALETATSDSMQFMTRDEHTKMHSKEPMT